MKKITVFTPSYNRAHLLPVLYKSLCRQTSRNFSWLIVDDGSTDNTKDLIASWIEENKTEIQYLYKENGGMHTGHNTAYANIATELNVCIDSDDYMPDDAIEKILLRWSAVEDNPEIAGIIGLDADKDGKIIGTKIPENLKQGSLHELYFHHKVKGDKKLILKTDIVRQYPAYPEYKKERLVPLDVLDVMMGNDYDFVYSNEVYCIVEYQQEGSSRTIFKQYKQSPRGFAYARKIHIHYSDSLTVKIKSYIHLISSGIFAKDFSLPYKEVNPLMSLLALPFGVALNFYIRYRIRKLNKKQVNSAK